MCVALPTQLFTCPKAQKSEFSRAVGYYFQQRIQIKLRHRQRRFFFASSFIPFLTHMQRSMPSPSTQRELLSAGWPCTKFSNSGIAVHVLHRPSDSLQSVFTGELEFDADAGVDSSGLDVWSGACALMCSYIASNPELMHAFNVLELGSGTGVCGLFVAQNRFGAQSVALTDAGNFVMRVGHSFQLNCAVTS